MKFSTLLFAAASAMAANNVVDPQDKQIIETRMAQYAHTVDALDWPRFVALFTDDAPVVFADSNGLKWYDISDTLTYKNAQAMVDALGPFFTPEVQSLHNMGAFEYENIDANTIKTVNAITYQLGTKGHTDGPHAVGGGHYFITWNKIDGDWKLKDFRCQRIYLKEMTIKN